MIGAALSASALGQSPLVTVRNDMGPVVSRTQYLSHADPGQVLHVNVSLKSSNPEAFQAFVDDVSNPKSPNYRHFISPEEVGTRFGQSASAVQSVTNYLRSQGFTIKLVGKSRLNIVADGTVAQAEKAFNTTINRYQTVSSKDSGRPMFYSNAKPIQAPMSIASKMLTVTGLQNYSQPKRALLTLSQAQTLYGTAKEFSAGMYGQNRTIAYSNFDGYRLSNLAPYYQANSLPAPSGGVGSNVSIVTIDGGAGTGTPNGEGDLDMQMILGMAPQCNLIIYDGSQNETTVLTQEQDDNKADVISESYGWGFPPADEDANHQIHMAMSAQGITYLCASGDGGTSYLNQDQAAYPDIDPDVLTIGGTVATTDSAGNRQSETGWSQSGGGYTTDGAMCNVLPPYQKLGTTGMPTNLPYRLIPDVSLNASGPGGSGAFAFYWNGQSVNYGQGTSFSSPLFAGGLGIAEQKLISLGLLSPDPNGHQRFGRINDLFYSQNLRSDVWFDVTSGNNGSLTNGQASNAGIGWDSVTGLGVINFDAFVNSLNNNQPSDSVAKLSLNPTTVNGGQSSTGTITLSKAAPTGGWAVKLSSNDPTFVGVPGSITVSAGAMTATFTATTKSYSANYSATISASDAGSSQSANLSVTNAAVFGVSLNPSSVLGGKPSTGTVTLSSAAPSGGLSVSLGSSSSSATVPGTVTVASGATSATFTISTSGVSAVTMANISAAISNASKSATLTIDPPSVLSLSLAPTTVVGGNVSTATVTLNSAAPNGGMTIMLSSSSSAATVPSSLSVPAGAASATFKVSTSGQSATTVATISALLGGKSATAQLTIQPATLQSVSVSPGSVVGGSTMVAAGSVTFGSAAPPAGEVVTLTCSNTRIASVPASVKIASGSSSAGFVVSHVQVTSPQTVTITAKCGSVTQTTTLTITPFQLMSFSISPSTVPGGVSSIGQVTLNAAPASTTGALGINLSTTSKAISIPTTVAVLAGSSTGSFTIRTSSPSQVTVATVTASYAAKSLQASLTINGVTLLSVSVSPSTVKWSSTAPITGTVTLTGPAPAGGLVVALASSSTATITVPVSVTIPAGKTSATFAVKRGKVSNTATQVVTITATLAGTSKSATLTLTQ